MKSPKRIAKTDAKTLTGRELARYQATINWYASIVSWLLNHCEHLPLPVKELIREENNKRSLELGGSDGKT